MANASAAGWTNSASTARRRAGAGAPPTATMRFPVSPTSSKPWKLSGRTRFGWRTSPTFVCDASSSTSPCSWMFSRARSAVGTWAATGTRASPWLRWSAPSRSLSPPPTIHHSDQGVQYAATAYVQRLQGLGVTLSMATIGEARENGFAERLIRTIKEEEVYLSDYQDFGDALRHMARFLDDVYNIKRIHSALGYLTPREFEEQWRQGRQPATTTVTGAEDRATLASDPSADSGGNGMGRLALSRPPSHSFPTKALNAPSSHQRLDE